MARIQDFTPFIPGLPGAFSGTPPPPRRAPCKRGVRRAMRAWWAPNKLCGLPKLIWWGPTWPLKYFFSFKPCFLYPTSILLIKRQAPVAVLFMNTSIHNRKHNIDWIWTNPLIIQQEPSWYYWLFAVQGICNVWQ